MTEATPLTAIERRVLEACNPRCPDPKRFPDDLVEDLVTRGLLDWSSSPIVPKRSLWTTRRGLEALGA